MNLVENIAEIATPGCEADLLQEAFARFSTASAKLSERYERLAEETAFLRQKLSEKEEDVRRAERLAMLGEMAGGIAHEVRNPLGAIRLFASLLRQDLAEQPQTLELVKQIERSISDLDGVVSNILYFSKNSPPLTPLNLHALILEEIESFSLLNKGQLEWQKELNGPPFILGYEQGIRQITSNLFRNAAQAVGGEGVIVVATGVNAEQVELKIRDSGPGVPTELLETLFDPFVTGRAEGTGLGLAIVRRVVEQHNGRISVRNNPGAEFLISLPRGRSSISRKEAYE